MYNSCESHETVTIAVFELSITIIPTLQKGILKLRKLKKPAQSPNRNLIGLKSRRIFN